MYGNQVRGSTAHSGKYKLATPVDECTLSHHIGVSWSVVIETIGSTNTVTIYTVTNIRTILHIYCISTRRSWFEATVLLVQFVHLELEASN